MLVVCKRLSVVFALAAGAASALLAVGPARAEGEVRRSDPARDPFVIRPYLVLPGQREMTIAWTSATPGRFTVRCGRDDALDRRLTVSPTSKPVEYRKRPVPPATEGEAVREYQYLARLADLIPGSAYRYEVAETDGREPGRSGPAVGTFRTLLGPGRPFTFLVCGDSQAPDDTRRTAANFARYDLWLIVHVGDMVQRGGYWPNMNAEFFRPLAGLAGRAPVLPAVGNHDSWGVLGRLLRPRGRPYYSYDCGDVHFVCLDSFAGRSNRPRMREWLDRDLAGSKARWKIFYGHLAVYDCGAHHAHWGRTDFLPIYRKRGVDIVFAGHSHAYQRFRPMFTPGENETHPITHIITGPTGGYFHRLDRDPYLAAAVAHRHTFLVVDASAASLRFRAFDSHGRRIDAFKIEKDAAGRLSEGCRAGAVDETGFGRFRALIRPSLRTATLSADPRSGGPVTVRLRMTAADKAMAFTLKLEERSGATFEMAPVFGRCPAGRSAPVEAHVRLRDPAAYADPNTPLPVLRLECVFEIDGLTASAHTGRLTYRPPPPTTRPARESSRG